MLVPACEYPIARERALAVHFVYGEIRSAWRALDAQIPPPAEGSQLVYFLRDESGVLLYVGITGRGPVRLVEHYRTKDWFTRVARVDFERYDTRPEAERREVQAIKTLGPRYNVVHNTSGAR